MPVWLDIVTQMRVQIILDLELPDQIERADAIEIVAFRRWSTDARAPSICIVEYKHCHARRPGTMEAPRLFDNHVLELIGGFERSGVHGLPRTSRGRSNRSLPLIQLGRPSTRHRHCQRREEELAEQSAASLSSRPSETETTQGPSSRREHSSPSVTDRRRWKRCHDQL
jgi:hypothetical protein